MATKWAYLPILKWKQGERIALRELSPSHWAPIVPLIELPPIDAAPDAGLRTALPSFLSKIADGMTKAIPEDKPVAIDVRFVAPAYPRQVTLLATVCRILAKQLERPIIPVLSESVVASVPSDLHNLANFAELILRIQTPSMDSTQVSPLVKLAVSGGISRSRLHLVIDQYSIVKEDPKGRFVAVRPYLDAALSTGCASTTLSGGSFPINLVGFKQGVTDIPHVEWRIWEQLQRHGEYESIHYGDYAVTNPVPAPEVDPREMNPSVAIRYAADGHWRLFKAGGFKKGKPNQYQGLCRVLIGDQVYSGAHFSYGDACYDKAAAAKLGNGNPSSWRRDATNHHLALIAARL